MGTSPANSRSMADLSALGGWPLTIRVPETSLRRTCGWPPGAPGGRGPCGGGTLPALIRPHPDRVWNGRELQLEAGASASPCIFFRTQFSFLQDGCGAWHSCGPLESSIVKSDTFPGAEYTVGNRAAKVGVGMDVSNDSREAFAVCSLLIVTLRKGSKEAGSLCRDRENEEICGAAESPDFCHGLRDLRACSSHSSPSLTRQLESDFGTDILRRPPNTAAVTVSPLGVSSQPVTMCLCSLGSDFPRCPGPEAPPMTHKAPVTPLPPAGEAAPPPYPCHGGWLGGGWGSGAGPWVPSPSIR